MQTNDVSPTGPAAFGVIAERFRRAGQADKAVALCREGLEKFPDHLSARVTLGWSLLDLGEHQEAFDQLKSVLKRAPDNLAAIRGLAELHERGIGLVFDSLADDDAPFEVAGELDPVMEPAAELDPVMTPMGELDPVMAPMGELDPVMAPMCELDPVMALADELDPVMEPAADLDPIVAAPMAAELIQPEALEDLDPVVEPELVMQAAAAPTPEPARFEIEDVIDEIDADSMFDLSGMFEERPAHHGDRPMLVPAQLPSQLSSTPVLMREPIALFGREPLALRDEPADERVGELNDWLSRIRERRAESVSQYMAG